MRSSISIPNNYQRKLCKLQLCSFFENSQGNFSSCNFASFSKIPNNTKSNCLPRFICFRVVLKFPTDKFRCRQLKFGRNPPPVHQKVASTWQIIEFCHSELLRVHGGLVHDASENHWSKWKCFFCPNLVSKKCQNVQNVSTNVQKLTKSISKRSKVYKNLPNQQIGVKSHVRQISIYGKNFLGPFCAHGLHPGVSIIEFLEQFVMDFVLKNSIFLVSEAFQELKHGLWTIIDAFITF